MIINAKLGGSKQQDRVESRICKIKIDASPNDVSNLYLSCIAVAFNGLIVMVRRCPIVCTPVLVSSILYMYSYSVEDITTEIWKKGPSPSGTFYPP